MGILRGTAVIAAASGIEADANMNVWHFTAPDPVSDFTDALNAATNDGLGGFYQRLDGYFGRSCSAGTLAHRIDWAQVTPAGDGPADDTVSALVAQTFFTMSPQTGGDPLPSEVAIALSFNGNVAGVPVESGSTRPRSRRTGRIYLGFQDEPNNVYGASDLNSRPSSGLRDAILDSAELLVADVEEANGVWVVYSRAGADTWPITQIWVDDAWDTIRGRGPKPTTRETRDV